MKHNDTRRLQAGDVCMVIFCLFALLFVAFFAGWLPWHPVAVATGSMEPVIHPGDAVVVASAQPEKLQAGDIIQFRRGDLTVIHRIVEVTETPEGELAFMTRGDNNNAPDTDPVAPRDVLGRVVLVVPGLGKFSLGMRCASSGAG